MVPNLSLSSRSLTRASENGRLLRSVAVVQSNKLPGRWAVDTFQPASGRMSILPSLRHHRGLSRAFRISLAISVGSRRQLGIPSPVTLRWPGESITLRPRKSEPVVGYAVLGWDANGMGERAEAAQTPLAACR
jgi:hypothetical protein